MNGHRRAHALNRIRLIGHPRFSQNPVDSGAMVSKRRASGFDRRHEAAADGV